MTCVEFKGQLEGTGSGFPSGYQATMQIRKACLPADP